MGEVERKKPGPANDQRISIKMEPDFGTFLQLRMHNSGRKGGDQESIESMGEAC